MLSSYTTTENIQDFGVVSFGLDASGISDKSKIHSIEVSAAGLGVIGNTVINSVPFALYAEGALVSDSIRNLNINALKEFNAGDRDSLFSIFDKLDAKLDVVTFDNYVQNFTEKDGDATNELQVLSFDNRTGVLSITEGNSITLPVSSGGDNWGAQVVESDGVTIFGDGTSSNPLQVIGDVSDDQTLLFNSQTGELSISEGNTVTLPQSSGGDNWGSQFVVTDQSTLTGEGTSSSPLQVEGDLTDDQQITFEDNVLVLENGGKVDLSVLNTDDQRISFDAKSGLLSIEGGNSVTLPQASGGDNWGSQFVVTDQSTLTGEGTSSSPLQVAGDLTDDQQITFEDNVLVLENGGKVDLSVLNTDDQRISFDSKSGLLSIEGGNSVTLPQASGGDNWGSQFVVTDQSTLTGEGTSTSPLQVAGDLTDDQQITFEDNVLVLENGGKVDLSVLNTDNQIISLEETVLVLENGGKVDLSSVGDLTDDQRLAFNAKTGVLSIEGGNTVTLPQASGGDNWGSQAVATDGLTLTGDGTTNSPLTVSGDLTDNQRLNGKGTLLGLTNGGSVDLSTMDIDNQTLTYSSRTGTLSIEGGNSVILPQASGDDWGSQTVATDGTTLTGDGTSKNPIKVNGVLTDNQTLTLVENTLTLENGGEVDLSSFSGGTDDQTLQLEGSVLHLEDGGTPVDLDNIGYLTNVVGGTGLTESRTGNVKTINVNARNGLTSNANTIVLGGALIQDTQLDLGDSRFTYNLDGGGDFVVKNKEDYFSIFVQDGGNVGVGTNNPKYPLEIAGSRSFTFSGSDKDPVQEMIAGSGNLNNVSNGENRSRNVSIWVEEAVAADRFVAKSDERIKKNISISNSEEDLSNLMNIEIVDYHFIDTIGHGNQDYKKVIAQQLKEIYPMAVTDNLIDLVPDIYKSSEIKEGWVEFDSVVKVGEVIQIYYNETGALFEVKEVAQNKFKIDLAYEGEVFIYGHQVTDFHTVDYEAVSMLNVSATQEIYRHVQELEKENKALKESNADYESRIENLEASLNAQQEKDQQVHDLLEQLQQRLILLEATNSVGQK